MTATTSGSRMALTIDTQDEGVRIAAAALKDMREGNPPVDPTSFAASRHERSQASHSPTRREHLFVPFFLVITAQFEFLPFLFHQVSQPATPSLLSIASSATSNSFDTPQLIGVDRSATPNSVYSQPPSTSESSPSEFHAPASPQDVYLRRLPFVNTALKSYDYAKNNSRVVKFGAEMVESSVKTISKPVINRLPGAVTNRVSCCLSLRLLHALLLAAVFATRVLSAGTIWTIFTLASRDLQLPLALPSPSKWSVRSIDNFTSEATRPPCMVLPHINCLSIPMIAREFPSLALFLGLPRRRNTDMDIPSSLAILAPIATGKIKTGIVILTAPVVLRPLVVSGLRRTGWMPRGAE